MTTTVQSEKLSVLLIVGKKINNVTIAIHKSVQQEKKYKENKTLKAKSH